MNMITLGYWRTRAGDKVRVICVDAPGDEPVVALGHRGGLYTYLADGVYYSDRSLSGSDLIAPWVDPPAVRECWGLFTEHGFIDGCRTKEDAERVAHDGCWASPPTVHHMREVNPAREAAVEKLRQAALELAGQFPGTWGDPTRAALAALDAAEGVK
jgi:hypothetical protein